MAKYPKAAPVKKKPAAPAKKPAAPAKKKPAAPAKKKPAAPAKPKPRKREGDAEDSDSVPLARLKRKVDAEDADSVPLARLMKRKKPAAPAKKKPAAPAKPKPRKREVDAEDADSVPLARLMKRKMTAPRTAPVPPPPPPPSSSDDSDSSSSDDASASEEAAKPTAAAAAANWTVRIRWRGDELPLSIASDCTTDALKRLIDAKTGGRLPPERCALSYRGEPLVDGGALLARAGVVDGDAFDLRIAAATPPRPNAAFSSGALAASTLGAGAGASGAAAAAAPSNARLPLGYVGNKGGFSEAEARKLLEGVETHGAGRWAAIQKWGFGPEERARDAGIRARTQVDLKDKWRNMVAMTTRPEGFKFRAKYVTEAFLRRVSVAAESAEARTKETETKESEELARRREMVRLAWEKRQRAASE